MAPSSADGNSNSSRKLCERCGKPALTGFKCTHCGVTSYYSYGALLRSAEIIDDNKNNSCEQLNIKEGKDNIGGYGSVNGD